jgi:hypothetical protein
MGLMSDLDELNKVKEEIKDKWLGNVKEDSKKLKKLKENVEDKATQVIVKVIK